MRKTLALLIWMGLILAGCEGIDCTINNVVTCNYTFYASGNQVSVDDTLTVTAAGSDSVLFNRGYGISTLSLPMSYWQNADTLDFNFVNADNATYTLTLRIKKTNIPHFENPDCPTTMFHELLQVDYDESTANVIDSVVVTNNLVQYGSFENIKIYLHSDD